MFNDTVIKSLVLYQPKPVNYIILTIFNFISCSNNCVILFIYWKIIFNCVDFHMVITEPFEHRRAIHVLATE